MTTTPANQFWERKQVFVTGAFGFLGSWVCDQLLEWGATVVGLRRDFTPVYDAGDARTRSAMHVVHGCLTDYDCLLRALNENEIDTVFHLGAQPIVGTANRNPRSTFEANIRGTWNVLEACRQVSTVKRVVVASSDKAYGANDNLPYHEGMPLQGRHPYDVSKSCTDLIAQTYHETYGVPVCITRCGNFFGGRDLNFNRIVPGTIRSTFFGEPMVIRSDGTFIRDYIYVRDVVHAYLELARQMDRPELHGHAFNFSNEVKLSVLDLTQKIISLMGRSDLEPVILNEVHGEIKDQYLSAQKARDMLAWKPQFTIDEALAETIGWYRSYFESQARIEGVGARSVPAPAN